MATKDFLEETVCNLCGANEYSIVYKNKYENETAQDLKDKFKSSGDETLIDQVVKCKQCGLIYINPRIKPDLILQGYSEGSDEIFVSQAPGRERTFARCLDIIERYTQNKRGKILDIGAANGSFLFVAKQRGWEISGVEPNVWMCNWAKKHYEVAINPSTLFEQKYPDKSFDVITIWGVLEHVPNPNAVLEECNRILKEEGVLVINYPNIGSWIAKILGRK